MNKEIITIENIPEIICWWDMQFQLDEKTILHYINIDEWSENEEGIDIPDSFDLSITFYDCHYIATIYWDNIVKNWNSICADGPSILFSSFTDNLEDTHWNLIIQLIKKLVNEQNN